MIIFPKAKKKTKRRALIDQETENVQHTIQNHEHGLFLALLYYLVLLFSEALGLQWGYFDFDEDRLQIQRGIDYGGSTVHDRDLKSLQPTATFHSQRNNVQCCPRCAFPQQ